MSFIGNLIWIVFGGLWMALGWLLSGLLMLITVIGIPWAWSCFEIASYTFAPFGKAVVPKSLVTGEKGIGEGTAGKVANVIWFIFAGIWLAIGHVFAAILTACTIIGIPFAWQHLKIAKLALAPVGKKVVTKREAELLQERVGSAAGEIVIGE